MSLEAKLISLVKENPLPKYYVYYDEWSGEIYGISSKLKRSEYAHILTDDSVAADIMMGKLNPKKYIVADLADGTTLVPKDDVLRIKAAEDRLSKIPVVSTHLAADINVIMYVYSWLMEINISHDTMFKLTGKRFSKKYSKNDNPDNRELDLYIIKKNDPTVLIDTIKVDPIELINNGYILRDMSHLKTVCGLADVDILTKRMFKTYGLKIKNNYVTVDYYARKSQRRNHVKIKSVDSNKDAMFSLTPVEHGYMLKSNFNNPTELKIYKDLRIFLTHEDPNELIGEIVIPLDSIGKFKEFFVKTQINLSGCCALIGEEGKNLTFEIKGFKNV